VTALFVHLFKHFCRRLYRLAIIHSVTDGRTDDIMMPTADRTASVLHSSWQL